MVQHGSNKYAEIDEIAFALNSPSRFQIFTLAFSKASKKGSNNFYFYIKGNRYKLNLNYSKISGCYDCKLFQNNSRSASNWFTAAMAQIAIKRCMELFFDYIDSFHKCDEMFRAYVPDVLTVATKHGVEAHFPTALTPHEIEIISSECIFRVDSYEWISPKQINVQYQPSN